MQVAILNKGRQATAMVLTRSMLGIMGWLLVLPMLSSPATNSSPMALHPTGPRPTLSLLHRNLYSKRSTMGHLQWLAVQSIPWILKLLQMQPLPLHKCGMHSLAR